MKKMVLCISFFVASLVLFGSLDLFASNASAETHTYDGKSPYYNNCADSAVTKKNVKINLNGASANLELKFSTTCKTAWAKLTLSRPAKADGEATALVVRNTDNKQFSCASPGGNGEINKGQTSCYTPMVYDLDPRKAQAVAYWPYTAGETGWY